MADREPQSAFERSSIRSRVTPAVYKRLQRNATAREMNLLMGTRAWRSMKSAYEASRHVLGNWQSEWHRTVYVDLMPEFQVRESSDSEESDPSEESEEEEEKEVVQRSRRRAVRRRVRQSHSSERRFRAVGACMRLLAHLVDLFIWQIIGFLLSYVTTPAPTHVWGFIEVQKTPMQQMQDAYRQFIIAMSVSFLASIYFAMQSQKSLGHALFGFKCIDRSSEELASTGSVIAWQLLSIPLCLLDPLHLMCSSEGRTLSQRLCDIRVVEIQLLDP